MEARSAISFALKIVCAIIVVRFVVSWTRGDRRKNNEDNDSDLRSPPSETADEMRREDHCRRPPDPSRPPQPDDIFFGLLDVYKERGLEGAHEQQQRELQQRQQQLQQQLLHQQLLLQAHQLSEEERQRLQHEQLRRQQ